jgi:hypothetical protein
VKRLALLPLDWLLVRFVLPKNTFVVAGDRRSGNHACIYWVLSCIAGKDVLAAYGKQGSQGIRHYPLERITFVNDITNIPSALGIRGLIVRNRYLLRTSSVAVLSFEDVSPESICAHPLLSKLQTIRVQRNMVDLLASRYERLVELALEGGGLAHLFSMDERWFVNLFRWHMLSKDAGTDSSLLIWVYDKWILSAHYRSSFLFSMNLASDIFPIQHAAEGGGSSFQSSSASVDRLLSVSHRASFQAFLRQALERYPECFSPDDEARVTAFLSAKSSMSLE